MLRSGLIIAAIGAAGCRSGDTKQTSPTREHKPQAAAQAPIAALEPASAKCAPNHEPELPELFACQADINNGFSVYEWEVKQAGDFMLSVLPQPPDELSTPVLKISDATNKIIQNATGATTVELRAHFLPGRYSVVVTTAATAARHFRLAAARDTAVAKPANN